MKFIKFFSNFIIKISIAFNIIIFYVNGDFNDGELYFPKLNFEYKPQAGDFITFPSSKDYLHGVKIVGEGPSRYALSGFAWAAGTIDSWTKDH